MTKRGRFDSPIEGNPFAVCPYVRNECENSVSMQKSIMLINIKEITPTALFASLPFFLFSFAVFKHPGAQKTTSIFKKLTKMILFQSNARDLVQSAGNEIVRRTDRDKQDHLYKIIAYFLRTNCKEWVFFT